MADIDLIASADSPFEPWIREAARAARERITELERRIAKVEEFHPIRKNPRHGCCAPPKLCEGHPDECGSISHGLNKPTYPCSTIRILRGEN